MGTEVKRRDEESSERGLESDDLGAKTHSSQTAQMVCARVSIFVYMVASTIHWEPLNIFLIFGCKLFKNGDISVKIWEYLNSDMNAFIIHFMHQISSNIKRRLQHRMAGCQLLCWSFLRPVPLWSLQVFEGSLVDLLSLRAQNMLIWLNRTVLLINGKGKTNTSVH